MPQTITPLSMVVTTKDKISQLPLKDGQMIFLKDKQRIYWDWDKKRSAYHDILELATHTDRTGLENPVNNKIYLVDEDYTLWQYRNGEWFALTREPNVVFKSSPVDLSSTPGKKDVLYVAGKQLYIYNTENSSFEEIAKQDFKWGDF